MKSFTFDVKMFACITVKAENEKAARAMLDAEIDCAEANLGAWPDGSPIICEVSIDGEADLVDDDTDEVSFDPENIHNLPSIAQSIREDQR